MKLNNKSNNKIEYTMEKDNKTVVFTIIDMGEYIGYKTRNFSDPIPKLWTTMYIDIIGKNKPDKISGTFLVDSNGSLIQLSLKNQDNIQRVCNIFPYDYKSYAEEQKLRGKSIIKVDDCWAVDSIIVPNVNNQNKYFNFGHMYIYDRESKKYKDDDGMPLAPNNLTDEKLVQIFIELRKKMDYIFNLQLGKIGNIPKE